MHVNEITERIIGLAIEVHRHLVRDFLRTPMSGAMHERLGWTRLSAADFDSYLLQG